MNATQLILIELLGAGLALAFAVRIGWLGLVALRSRRARIAGEERLSGKNRPGIFWTIIIVQAGFVALCLFIAARRIAPFVK